MPLSAEEMFDRPLGGSVSQGQVPHWLGNILWVLVGAFCKVIGRYRVRNRQTLRDFVGKQGVVVVGNHASYLDVAFLYCAVRPRQWIRFMARESLFAAAGGLAGQIMARVGAFPVRRDSADLAAVKRAARMLKRGEVVGIFPEGTRRGKGSQQPQVHGGAAMVAKMGHAPLLPVTVRNAEKVKQEGRMVRFPKVTVEFGNPIRTEWFDFLPKEQRYEACTWYALRECYALSQEVPAESVDMARLFPTCADYTQVFAGRTFPPQASPDAAAGAASRKEE